ncbi:hypothetical protein, partial [Streptomyces sp. NPDC054756]
RRGRRLRPAGLLGGDGGPLRRARHSPAGAPRPKRDATDAANSTDGTDVTDVTDQGDARAGRLKKTALWIFLALCVVFIAWVAWGFVQFDQDIDHPREGGFSGWQCDAGKDC